MKRCIINDTTEVYVRQQPYGYGFEVMQKTKLAASTQRPEGAIRYTKIFHSYDKQKVLDVFKDIETTKQLPAQLPPTVDESIPARVLVFKGKHDTAYYDVHSLELLEKTCRHILTTEAHYYYKPEQPTNDSGVNSLEDIDKIPFKDLQIATRQKFEAYNEALKAYNIKLEDWDNLQHVIDGKGTLADVIDAMQIYENDNYEIEQLTAL